MIDAGATAAMLAAAIEADQQLELAKQVERRGKDAERQRRWRATNKVSKPDHVTPCHRDKTLVTVTDEHIYIGTNSIVTNSNKPIVNNKVDYKYQEVSRARARESADHPDFGRFWSAYPRRDGRKAASKAFNKAILKVPIEQLLGAITTYIATKPDYQDFAMPASWLNGERWNDEVRPTFTRPPTKRDTMLENREKNLAALDAIANREDQPQDGSALCWPTHPAFPANGTKRLL